MRELGPVEGVDDEEAQCRDNIVYRWHWGAGVQRSIGTGGHLRGSGCGSSAPARSRTARCNVYSRGASCVRTGASRVDQPLAQRIERVNRNKLVDRSAPEVKPKWSAWGSHRSVQARRPRLSLLPHRRCHSQRFVQRLNGGHPSGAQKRELPRRG